MSTTKSENKTAELEKVLAKERIKWYKRFNSIIYDSKYLNRIPEGQIFMLSYRHKIVDRIASLENIINHKKSSNDKKHKELFESYKLKGIQGIRLDKNEINDFIKADMSESYKVVELLRTHVKFLQNTIETYDKLAFVYKNNIEIIDH